MLEWLLTVETRDGHLSVVPAGGWGPGEDRPAFDQQPIEVAALADACMRAATVTGDSSWLAGVEMSVSWFLGDNDAKVPLLDERTGGGCDGLSRDGRSRNQGAESTLAMISVLQLGVRLSAGAAMTQDPAMSALLTRTPHRLKPDASRTLCRLFVPGQETLIRGESRAMAVIDRILDLSEEEVERTLTRTLTDSPTGIATWPRRWSATSELVAHRLGERDPGGARATAADRRLFHSGVRARGRGPVQPVDGRAPGPGGLPAR